MITLHELSQKILMLSFFELVEDSLAIELNMYGWYFSFKHQASCTCPPLLKVLHHIPHSLQKKNWKRVKEREMLPSKVSAALNQGLVEDHMSFCAQISPLSYPSFPPHGIDQQTTGGLDMDRGFASNLREVLPSMLPGYRAAPSDDDGFGQLGASSEQRSSNNLWSWSELEGDLGDKRSTAAEDYHNKKNNNSSSNNNIHRLSVGAIRTKKVKTRKNVREPRFCFKTLSEVDVLDDGYKWRKYGRKVVKNTQHPRYTLKKGPDCTPFGPFSLPFSHTAT